MKYFFEYNDFRCELEESVVIDLEDKMLCHVGQGASGSIPERFGAYHYSIPWILMIPGPRNI